MKKENILINGCSRGLGFDFLKHLNSFYNVYGLSSIKKNSENIFYYNPIQDINLSKELIQKLKSIKIDHVIHCSGGGFKKHDKLLDVKSLQNLFDVNFYSIYEINRFLIKKKLKNQKLNIIMFGSLAAFENNKGSIGYSAAKSVLLNYNKNLASSFVKYNVITKLVIPGSFLSTRGSMNRLRKNNIRIFSKLEKEIPHGRMQSSRDIIKFCEFLLKKESDLLNGSSISLTNLESKSIFI